MKICKTDAAQLYARLVPIPGPTERQVLCKIGAARRYAKSVPFPAGISLAYNVEITLPSDRWGFALF